MGATISSPSSPLKYSVEYPERLSRGILLLRTFFGVFYAVIPHGIILGLYGVAVSIVQVIAWWGIVFTDRYPKAMFDFIIPYIRWSLRFGAYMSMFTDKYPPFSGDENIEYPVKFSIDYPEKLSLLLARSNFGWAYVLIPHGVILVLYGIAVAFVQFIAWWAVLFTAVYPRSMFDFVVSFMRWGLRVNAYLGYFTDVYPPFNGSE